MSMEIGNEQETLELEGKFKTAAELGLQHDQYCGLVKTLAYMEASKLKHVPYSYSTFIEGAPFTGHFNMGNWRVEAECGTICCIGGTAEILGNCILRSNSVGGEAITTELTKLFYPGYLSDGVGGGYLASPRQAAVALRHYLTTGKANWRLAMASPK